MVEITENNDSSSHSQQYAKTFAKQMLKNTIFIGNFHEKRFVEPLNAYRDVICISAEETEFIQNLIAVKKKIEQEFIKLQWLGITGPQGIGSPAGYNIWVELPIEVFGKYWFKVKTVDFQANQVTLKLEVLRPVKKEHTSCENISPDTSFSDFSFNICTSQMKICLKQVFFHLYNDILTKQNITSSIVFISFLVTTLVLSTVDMLKFLLEYLLHFMHELSKLITSFTPILVSLVNLLGRTVFGFYQLIATLFKRSPPPQPVYNAYISYDPQNGMPNSFDFNKQFPRALPSTTPRSRGRIMY